MLALLIYCQMLTFFPGLFFLPVERGGQRLGWGKGGGRESVQHEYVDQFHHGDTVQRRQRYDGGQYERQTGCQWGMQRALQQQVQELPSCVGTRYNSSAVEAGTRCRGMNNVGFVARSVFIKNEACS